MKINKYLILLTIVFLTQGIFAQTKSAKKDIDYFKFWIGNWHQVIDGKVADQPRFVVKRAMNDASFEESWLMEGYMAKAWRAWDTRTKKWDFAWMTDDGLFQIWEGRKVNGIWYIYKTFIINGEKVLSRQAFMFPNDKTLIRTSEHSKDKGKSWRLRWREKYVKRE